MTRNARRTLGAALSLALAFPAAPLLAGHGGSSHGGSSHGGGSHHGGSRGGGSRGTGSHHGGGSRGHGSSRGRSRTDGDWIFFGAPWWGGLGWWYPDGGPYVEAPGEDPPGEEEPESDDPTPSARAMLTFSVEPDDAVVYVDGHLLGTAEEAGRTLRGVPVAPGKHTIAVERPGLAEWSTEIDLAPGETKSVEVSLER